MRFNQRSQWIVLVAAGLLLAACTVPEMPPTDDDRTALTKGEGQQIVNSDVSRNTAPDVAGPVMNELAESNTAFALDLYQQIRDEESNLFYSPYSISVALAMTYAGARGETAEQMADTLHFTLSQERLHAAFNAMDLRLTQQAEAAEQEEPGDRPFTLNIANALWGQEGYGFEPAFLDLLAANYGAGMRLVNFSADPEAARTIINEWIRMRTEGKIKDLLKPGVVDASTRLVLTNAIYFKALWQHQFEEEQTQDGTFTRIDDSTVTVPMMSQTESFRYADAGGVQAIELPYRNSNTSMLILLPDAGTFDEFEGSLTPSRIDAITEQLQMAGVTLTMPKFEFEAELGLSETLAAMGMPAAFGADADFSGMTGDRSLFISDVVHKAFVGVDEEGTEAAAATAVVMAESAMVETVEMTIDRPFIFLIRDNDTGTVLFLGRMMDPTA